MTVARAKHYPQPLPAGDVLAELAGARCVHGEVDTSPPRCPLCRATEPQPDPPHEPPEPTTKELPDGWLAFTAADQT
jgi:hypothetical protein